ncbi:protein phosphatase 2C domain-containing protein [Paenibacillus cisolokensis]|nr:protein phosphatase 2C domain-containing protein [Paenibacillus sp. 32O-W]ALS26264.1 protein phosphatase 2C [Paenibacillus sp. 32O-W]
METISIKGTGEWNEDALVVNGQAGLYGVLDGATSLHPFRGPNGETGGYLASHLIQDYFQALNREEASETPLNELVLRANTLLREAMRESGIDLSDKSSLWTSALALVRIHEKYVDFAQAGDCMIAALYEDGSVRNVSRDHVDHVDYESRKIWMDGIRRGIRRKDELWELVKPVILKNKERMNTLSGYSVLSGQPEAADFIEYGRINRIGLRSLLLVTDGLFLPRSSMEPQNMDWGELVKQIREKRLSGYADWLIRLETGDAECQRYPRFKVSDDKTGIWIDFQASEIPN